MVRSAPVTGEETGAPGLAEVGHALANSCTKPALWMVFLPNHHLPDAPQPSTPKPLSVLKNIRRSLQWAANELA